MHTFALLSSVLTLAGLFGFVSYRVLRLPPTVGTMVLALLLSGVLLMASAASSGAARTLSQAAEAAIGQLDFSTLVLHGMLAFLLFAAALSLDVEQLAREKVAVAALSIVGTLLSTVLVAGLLYFALPLLGFRVDGLFCLLFGALIAPTDPIAVVGMLRRVGAPLSMQTRLTGESLFNDGVGAVIFLALLRAGNSGSLPTLQHFLALLLLEAGGGIALGLALGYIVHGMLRAVDDYRVEVTLTLALCTGSYALADTLHLSAPLAVIAAGMVVNGRASRFAMSRHTREPVETFWHVVDEILNVVLFLLLGLELLGVPLRPHALFAGLMAIPAVLISRYLSVGCVLGALHLYRPQPAGSVRVLTWAGLRGGLSVALALGLPEGAGRSLALTMTYVVVVFSVLVQGLSVGTLLRRLGLSRSP